MQHALDGTEQIRLGRETFRANNQRYARLLSLGVRAHLANMNSDVQRSSPSGFTHASSMVFVTVTTVAMRDLIVGLVKTRIDVPRYGIEEGRTRLAVYRVPACVYQSGSHIACIKRSSFETLSVCTFGEPAAGLWKTEQAVRLWLYLHRLSPQAILVFFVERAGYCPCRRHDPYTSRHGREG